MLHPMSYMVPEESGLDRAIEYEDYCEWRDRFYEYQPKEQRMPESNVYVAACGTVFKSHRAGRNHERLCHECLAEIYEELPEDFEEEEDDESE